jgi:hypothetical protein
VPGAPAAPGGIFRARRALRRCGRALNLDVRPSSLPDVASSKSSLIAGWCVAGLALLLAAGPLLSAFTILAVVAGAGVVAVYAVATVVVLFSVGRAAAASRTPKAWAQLCAVPLLFAVLFFGSYTIMWVGNRAYSYARFAVLYPAYSSIVSGLSESQLVERRGTYGFVRYEVESGPPVRIVFPHFGGITDNWVGTVYDPTDEVGKATGWKYSGETQEYTAPDNIKGLFGGDIVSCARLLGHYFLCTFT